MSWQDQADIKVEVHNAVDKEAVQITHIPTGIKVEAYEFNSQRKNREKCFRLLKLILDSKTE